MNELINIIVAIAFPFTVIVVAFLVLRNNRIKAKKPTINDRYNQSRPMATYKEPVISDAEEFDKLINDQEFMNLLEDEV